MKKVTRHQWISEAAYYQAEARKFAPSRELNDWLLAEMDYVTAEITHYLATVAEDGGLTIMGLQDLAKSVGVENSEKIMQKIELIQSIQNASHHFPASARI